MMKIFRTITLIFSSALLFFLSRAQVFAADAVLELSPSSGEIKEGETLDIDINVDTDGAEISAVDVVITFDSDKLALSVDDSETLFSVLAPDTEYIVDNDLGEARFSNYVGSTEETFSGVGKVITFKATAKTDSGTANINFVAEEGDVQDSNVVDYETVSDILSSVVNGSYTLISSTGPTDESPTPTPTPEPTESPDEEEPTPTPEPTITEEDSESTSETTEDTTTPDTGIIDFSTFFALVGATLLFSGLLLVF